jgi:hypothetical protein
VRGKLSEMNRMNDAPKCNISDMECAVKAMVCVDTRETTASQATPRALSRGLHGNRCECDGDSATTARESTICVQHPDKAPMSSSTLSDKVGSSCRWPPTAENKLCANCKVTNRRSVRGTRSAGSDAKQARTSETQSFSNAMNCALEALVATSTT